MLRPQVRQDFRFTTGEIVAVGALSLDLGAADYLMPEQCPPELVKSAALLALELFELVDVLVVDVVAHVVGIRRSVLALLALDRIVAAPAVMAQHVGAMLVAGAALVARVHATAMLVHALFVAAQAVPAFRLEVAQPTAELLLRKAHVNLMTTQSFSGLVVALAEVTLVLE